MTMMMGVGMTTTFSFWNDTAVENYDTARPWRGPRRAIRRGKKTTTNERIIIIIINGRIQKEEKREILYSILWQILYMPF
jgi:hypothetical protein